MDYQLSLQDIGLQFFDFPDVPTEFTFPTQYVWLLDIQTRTGKRGSFTLARCIRKFFGYRFLPADLNETQTVYERLYRIAGITYLPNAKEVVLILNGIEADSFPVEDISTEQTGSQLMFLVEIPLRDSKASNNLQIKLELRDADGVPLEVIMDKTLTQSTKPKEEQNEANRFSRLGLKAIPAPFWFPLAWEPAEIKTEPDNNNTNTTNNKRARKPKSNGRKKIKTEVRDFEQPVATEENQLRSEAPTAQVKQLVNALEIATSILQYPLAFQFQQPDFLVQGDGDEVEIEQFFAGEADHMDLYGPLPPLEQYTSYPID
mmetsp:Transcript_14953/g.20903  ORF Transcript_14953/g.20903 Transcript_14953/m.20903 type:complete len:317 (-) Transcript_14953:42-992(-)